jgi:hypothetical protein
VIGHRRAVDSTGIADSVLTQDTDSLIRSAMRACLDRLGALDAHRAGQLCPSLGRDDYQLCWESAVKRARLVNELFIDAANSRVRPPGRPRGGSLPGRR